MFIGGIAIGLIALFLLEACLLLSLVVWERPYSALISFLVSAGVADFFFGTGIYATVWHQPITAVGFVLAYIGLGVAWSFPKWWFYVRRIRDQYTDALQRYKRHARIPLEQKLTQDQIDGFFRHVHEYGYMSTEGYRESWSTVMPVQASKNKNKILVWMMYWPFSLVWTLIDEPFKKAFYFLFDQIKGLYQSISERAFAGVEVYDSKHRGE